MPAAGRRETPAAAPLVDLQVNGGWGVDFSSPELSAADVAGCVDAWRSAGTAALLATMVSSPLAVYRRNIPIITDAARSPGLRGRLLGLHLEGPFVADDARVRGAHRSENLRPPDVGELLELVELGAGAVRLVTVAAELPGIADVIRAACAHRVAVSVGHSHAGMAELDRAADAGATALTHLGNALPRLMDKRDNPLLAGLLANRLSAMVIVDDHHLGESLLRLVFRACALDRLVAVSDAAPVAGLPPGRYRVFDQDAVATADGQLLNPAEDHLVGSMSSLRTSLRTLVRRGICSAAAAARVGSAHPLALLGLTPRDLAADAPVTAFDEQLADSAP